ncbi:MAG: recombinase family protein [Campylobacterota bacterium]|nr:recombinase family protein [Campylobacterota bacterium]
MIYAYLRQLSGKRNIAEQQSVILSFSLGHGLNIDKEVIEYSNKNRPIEEREQFEKFIHGLKEEDAIVVDEIWMLSEKVDEIVKIINCMLSRGITLYSASSGTVINPKSTVSEIFPLLNTLREEQRSRQNQIGRPKGSRSSSKFDKYQAQIIAFLKEGMNVSAIARELGVSRSSLKDYIESRGIREMIEGSWVEISQSTEHEVDDKILICPFEQENEQPKRRKAWMQQQ